MNGRIRNVSLDQAIQDFQNRTLAEIPGDLARLVYFASIRDYNTGQYHHDGLAYRFNEELASSALQIHHRETFRKMVFTSLEELVGELDAYMRSARVLTADFLGFWQRLEPYRVAVPLDCDTLAVEVFCSNIRVALAILQNRQETSAKNRE